MARPSIHRLNVSLEQFEWIAKTVARKAELALKIEKDKKLKEVVLKLADKFKVMPLPQPNGEYLLTTNRLEIRFLSQVVSSAHAVHVATIIPGYAEKSQKDPYFTPRHDQAVKVSILLNDLNNRINRIL